MEESNKRGKYVLLASFMFSTFTFNQHISISMIRIVWSIISSSNNSDSITHYISTIFIFALGSKISYTDEYLSSESENDHSDIFDPRSFRCKVFLFFLAFLAMAIYLS